MTKSKKLKIIFWGFSLFALITGASSFFVSKNISTDINNQLIPVASHKTTRELETTIINEKADLNLSNYFAGDIYYEIIKNNYSEYLVNALFDGLLEVDWPPPNQYRKRLSLVNYDDQYGRLEFTAQISPYMKDGRLINEFSPIKRFVISGFKVYDAATQLTPIENYPTDLKPSEINNNNVENFVEIINLPNDYETPHPTTTYQFDPNDANGTITISVSLTSAIISQDNGTSFKFEGSRSTIVSTTLNNLSTQAPTVYPTASSPPIDGSSLDVIASKVTDLQVKNLIYSNCNPKPNNLLITDISKIPNNEARTLTVSFVIKNYYNDKGIYTTTPIQVTGVVINNLKEPINTTILLKKEGDESLLAQDVYNWTSTAIINEYIDIENKCTSPETILNISNKNFDNRQGTLSFDVNMINYYQDGDIITNDSKPTHIEIQGFKTTNPSTCIPNNENKNFLASDVSFTDSNSEYFVENFISYNNFPDGTIFNYLLEDVNNATGRLSINIYPSSWYDGNGKMCSQASGDSIRIPLLIENFEKRYETTISKNNATTTTDLIGDIFPSDVTKQQALNYLDCQSLVNEITENDIGLSPRNSSGILVVNVKLSQYYNNKGLLVDSPNQPKVFNIYIEGFKSRTLSAFKPLSTTSEILPSDVNSSNWQTYIDYSSFPDDAEFNNLTFIPTNKDGVLIFSATPTKYYDYLGSEIINEQGIEFTITIRNMKKNTATIASAIIKNNDNQVLFDYFPNEFKSFSDEQLKSYVNVVNPYDNISDNFSIDHNTIICEDIKGSVKFNIILTQYYDRNGNPVIADDDKVVPITITNLKQIVPNFFIISDVDKDIASIDPYDFLKDPSLIEEYITFEKQLYEININGELYDKPIISILEISDNTSELNDGKVTVTYSLSNYFNELGEYIETANTFTVTIGGFKTSLHGSFNNYLAIILIAILAFIIVLVVIICLGILFRKKKYYINESYDRSLITTDDATIKTVIQTRDKLTHARPKLIPLLKEIKPPKRIKKYKPIKQKQVKVKPPKPPILPGQRKRELLQEYAEFKANTKNKLLKIIKKDKNPINDPFEINNQWYYRDEEGNYFVSDQNGQWTPTKKPRNNVFKKMFSKKDKQSKE